MLYDYSITVTCFRFFLCFFWAQNAVGCCDETDMQDKLLDPQTLDKSTAMVSMLPIEGTHV